MNYLVMECHRSYAIVLDNEGRFLKVANLGYDVGQELDHVIEAKEPDSKVITWRKQYVKILTAAACLCLVFLGSWKMMFSTYGTVRIKINPDVQISVNRLDYVTDLKGLNADGKELIQGVRTFGKTVDELSNELAGKAMKMGFLDEGGKISLTVNGKTEWKTATEERLILEMDVHFDNSITVIVAPQGMDASEIPVTSDTENDELDDEDDDDSDDDDDEDDEDHDDDGHDEEHDSDDDDEDDD